jgi:CheY-like chemotaxis protein
MARHALDAAGYSVEQAPDGEVALGLFDDGRQPPDLLVTDVVMPRVGGAELAQRLRERFPDLKVLFTSGYSYDAIGRAGELQAGTAFLQKPFTPAALARAVRDVLDGRSQPPSGETPAVPAG